MEVVAIENNKEIAKIYRDFFLGDTVVNTHAQQELIEY